LVALAAERAKDAGRRAADGGTFGRLVSDEESAPGPRPTRDRPLECSAKADLECGALVASPMQGFASAFGSYGRAPAERVVPTGPPGAPLALFWPIRLYLWFSLRSQHICAKWVCCLAWPLGKAEPAQWVAMIRTEVDCSRVADVQEPSSAALWSGFVRKIRSLAAAYRDSSTVSRGPSEGRQVSETKSHIADVRCRLGHLAKNKSRRLWAHAWQFACDDPVDGRLNLLDHLERRCDRL